MFKSKIGIHSQCLELRTFRSLRSFLQPVGRGLSRTVLAIEKWESHLRDDGIPRANEGGIDPFVSTSFSAKFQGI